MKKINLSVNPLYLCNFRCDFCYLTHKQLSDRNVMPLSELEKRLLDLRENGVQIEHVDLYGGEIGLLDLEYLESLDELLLQAGDPQINIVTNLSNVHPFFLKEHVDLSVSFDFGCRQSSEKVLQNIIGLNKTVAILMLASPRLLEKDVDTMIQTFSSIQNIVSVEVKPYSSNQANQLSCSDEDYEEFIKKWIDSSVAKNFEFVNSREIELSLSRKKNAFSDNHLYIEPSGKFAVLDFDQNSNEFFNILNSVDDYYDWCKIEKKRVSENIFCTSCEFYGHCLTEHYRNVTSLEKSCNGFYKLLRWAKEERQELRASEA